MFSVVVVLGILWAVIFGPSILRFIRDEMDRRSGGSIGSFNKSMGVLHNTKQRHAVPSGKGRYSYADSNYSRQPIRSQYSKEDRRAISHEIALKKQRLVILVLGFTTLLTGFIGMLPPLSAIWVLTVFSAVLLFIYIGAVKYISSIQAEKRQKLTPIQRPRIQTPIGSPSVVIIEKTKAN